MKTTQAEVDREAGQVFVPWPAMRVMWTATSRRWERVADGTAHTGHPFAIDTDDPATVGVMLAQVEAANPGRAVIVSARVPVPSEDVYCVVAHGEGEPTIALGPTRGAALVAAMRAFAGAAR